MSSLRFTVLASGVLFVVGCAGIDDGSQAGDGDQLGYFSAGQPDLIESTVGDPPANAVLGQSFSASDTVQNIGTADAGPSFTKYYLSTNGTVPQYLLGNRSVGTVTMGGGTDVGSGTTVTIPAGTPQGTYFVEACADRGSGTAGGTSQVAESNENNNCNHSTGTVMVTGPDLTESNVTASPTTIDATNGTLTVADTVNNTGSAPAGSSVTRWFLSTDPIKDALDAPIRNCTVGGPTPGRNVNPIVSGSDSGSSATTPLCVHATDGTGIHAPASGTYYVIACADTTNLVAETDETNQCATSAGTITITVCGNGIVEAGEQCDDHNTASGDGCSATCQTETSADLAATAVTDPPTTAAVNDSFAVTDTIANLGVSNAPASTNFYYLSSDKLRNSNDHLLTGTRSVPVINGGTSNAGPTSVTVPSGMPAGKWYLLVCADGPNAIAEPNEANNCFASAGQVTIGGVDLIESAVGDPPTAGIVGGSFSITDTVQNIGTVAAPTSFTKFYLSTNGLHLDFYLGTRGVAALNPGATDPATTTVTVQAGTASGTYKVIACADAGPSTSGRTSQIGENNENNNCTASTGTIVIGSPDLTITFISSPPGTGHVGDAFLVTDTTSNTGTTDTGAFFNKYYLSTNGTTKQFFLGTGTAGALAHGTSETVTGDTSGSAATKIRTGTPNGTYWVLGCADGGPGTSGYTSQIPETNENNNCLKSATQIIIN